MQKIVVPTDFSKNALIAVTYSSEVAQKTGAAIYLLHVLEPGVDVLIDSVAQVNVFTSEIVKGKMEQLAIVQKTNLENYPGIKVKTELARGTVVNSILDFAEGQQAAIIIMGTAGASGLKEFFMGSVAGETIRRAKIPVLTIPASYQMKESDKMLLATNHFEKNVALLKKIIAFSQLFSAVIYVVVFVDTDVEGIPEFKEYTNKLSQYIHFLEQTFPEIRFEGEVLDGKDFEITIDRYCNKHEVDIISMITYPKTSLDRILQKSVSKKMAFHSTIPLLVIHSLDDKAAMP
ncbi:MAG TPA: universal stress protein [Hanamia sp.]|nr:universal stress protein [Hanamia sp.]